jgi:arylsulfatase A-like enzyme
VLRRLPASPWLYFAAAVLALIAALASQLELRSDTRPLASLEALDSLGDRDDLNVLFILIDTLRADRLGSYGHRRPTSPVLDELARSGVRFANVVSQSSWTKCSMASLWTGMHPTTNGVVRYPHALPDLATLPAEILREAGFRTAGIWRNGWVDPSFGFGQGFDTYLKPRPHRDRERAERRGRSPYALIGNDWDVTESALSFLRTFGRERFFLYVHYMDVHQYVSDKSTAKFGNTYSDIYDNAIAWVDRNVEALVGALQAQDLFDRTLIVVASDHGEEFREHGGEGHARTLYREVTSTPLILSLPFRLEPGVVVEERIENVDVWPTLLELLGLPTLAGADGRSLVALIRAAAMGGDSRDGGERPALAYLDRTWGRVGTEPRPLLSLHEGRYRLLHQPDLPERDQLFDLATDPLEQEDRAAELPDQVARMQRLARERLGRPRASWGDPVEIELDEIQLQLLRALGYAVGAQRQRATGEESPQRER